MAMWDSSVSPVLQGIEEILPAVAYSPSVFRVTATNIRTHVTSQQVDVSVNTIPLALAVKSAHLVSMDTLWLAHPMTVNHVRVQTRDAACSCLVETLLALIVRKDTRDNAVISALMVTTVTQKASLDLAGLALGVIVMIILTQMLLETATKRPANVLSVSSTLLDLVVRNACRVITEMLWRCQKANAKRVLAMVLAQSPLVKDLVNVTSDLANVVVSQTLLVANVINVSTDIGILTVVTGVNGVAVTERVL